MNHPIAGQVYKNKDAFFTICLVTDDKVFTLEETPDTIGRKIFSVTSFKYKLANLMLTLVTDVPTFTTPNKDHPMNHPIKHAFTKFTEDDAAVNSLFRAWQQVTVLQDKSYENFYRIVLQCVDGIINYGKDGREVSNSSTGGVEVQWNRKTNRMAVYITVDKEWSGKVKHELKTGQKWKHTETDDIYIVSRITNNSEGFSLVNIDTGYTYCKDNGMDGYDHKFVRV